jgi:hypothetical protein
VTSGHSSDDCPSHVGNSATTRKLGSALSATSRPQASDESRANAVFFAHEDAAQRRGDVVPSEFAAAIKTALFKRPEDRPRTSREFPRLLSKAAGFRSRT